MRERAAAITALPVSTTGGVTAMLTTGMAGAFSFRFSRLPDERNED